VVAVFLFDSETALDKEDFDSVFMDVQMPEMGGLEAQ
jgi:CheY-like chemotaxis protein